jgi:hypothetical protein
MKTDLSFWNNNFPSIIKKPIEKLLYGKHIYKIEVSILGARCLERGIGKRTLDKFEYQFHNLETFIKRLHNDDFSRVRYRHSSLVPRWLARGLDYKFLSQVYQTLMKYDDRTKTRTGNWNLAQTGQKFFISTNDIKILEEIALLFKDRPNDVISITYPTSDIALKKISNGVILKKNPPKYKFQVKLSGRNWHPGKSYLKVLEYLTTLPEVHVPPGAKKRLERGFCIDGTVIYTDNPENLAFISLLDPYIIGKISPLEYIADK